MRSILRMVMPLIGVAGLVKFMFLGIFSGLFSFLFITFLTKVVGLIISGSLTTVSKEYIIIFAFIILFFVWIRKMLSLGIVTLSQRIFWTLRKQILNSVLNANYEQLSKRKIKVHAAILSDVYVLTDASMNIISFFISLVMGVACLIYLASISFVLFLITVVVAFMGAAVYHFGSIKNNKELEVYRSLENKFLESLNAILDGFKEIYMEPKKGRAIYDNKINFIAKDSYKNNISAFTGFLRNQITGQVLFYLLIASVLLVFSIILKIKATDIVSFVFTLLYLLGAIETIMVLLPGLVRARIACNHLIDLKNELEEANFSNPIPDKYIQKDEFDQIIIKDLEYKYHGDDNIFAIGPIDFQIKKGDIVFIYGGNGSGKTTFVHSVLGLNIPASGEIHLNDQLINNENYPDYRTLFSVVFSDFYLFNELHGMPELDIEKWNYYLELFEIQGKVELENNCFSTTDLSTGQRKRLALIVALLEEKPILVMDEWAADQDPYFRKKFYTEILPALKKQDITIIAITHDDKYYNCADRLYKMEEGKLIEESVTVHESPLV